VQYTFLWASGTPNSRAAPGSPHSSYATVSLMTTTAATARNIRLIEGTILTSHAGVACHLEHNAQGTNPNHGFNLLISVECTYVEEHYPRSGAGNLFRFACRNRQILTEFFRVPTKICENIVLDILKGVREES